MLHSSKSKCDTIKTDSHSVDDSYRKPVDMYLGGREHATLHLLYARFMSKCMGDLGLLPADAFDSQVTTKGLWEPFSNLFIVGMVLAETWRDKNCRYVPHFNVLNMTSEEKVNAGLEIHIEKMSKSKGNGVDPMDLLSRYSPEALRLFVLNRTHPSQDMIWKEEGIVGMERFFDRILVMISSLGNYKPREHDLDSDIDLQKLVDQAWVSYHKNWKKMALHNVISGMIKLQKTIIKQNRPSLTAKRKAISELLVMLYPFASEFSASNWKNVYKTSSPPWFR